MRRVLAAVLALLLQASPVLAAPTAASQTLVHAQQALKDQEPRRAISLLAAAVEDPARVSAGDGVKLLWLLAECSEAYVHGLNSRFWRRSRIDPLNPGWLSYIRKEQRWAERHLASFSYYEPRGRYRYDGDAYRLLVQRYPKDPMAEEADWRLILRADDGEHNLSENPALLDASRHERFLRKYPHSRHALAARLAIGWDYLYASGFTWGTPNPRRFAKGKHILEGIVQSAPASPEARQAKIYLERAAQPFAFMPGASAAVGVASGRARR